MRCSTGSTSRRGLSVPVRGNVRRRALPSALPPDSGSVASTPTPSPAPCARIPTPLYACLHRPPAAEAAAVNAATLSEIAEQFSPRYERHRDDLVSIDVSGLAHLVGPAQT